MVFEFYLKSPSISVMDFNKEIIIIKIIIIIIIIIIMKMMTIKITI